MTKKDERLAHIRDRLRKSHAGEIGTGITKRWRYEPKAKSEREELAHLMAGRPVVELPGGGLAMTPETVSMPLRERLALFEGHAAKVLNSSERYKARLAELKATTPETISAKELRHTLDAFGFAPYADPEWYALRVLALCRWIRCSLDDERVPREQLASDAMALAGLMSEWKEKEELEHLALRHEAGGNARRKKIAADKARAIEMAREIWNRPGPVAGVKEAAELIQATSELSHRKVSVIRRWLKEAEGAGELSIPPEAKRPGRRTDG